MPTLFHYPWAVYSRKALLAAYELGVELQEEVVPAFEPGAMAEMRRRTFPLATLPTLLYEDGTYLSESSVMIERWDLESATPGVLVPTDRKEALRVRWLDRLGDALCESTSYVVFAIRKQPAEIPHKKIEQTIAKLHVCLGVFEAQLEGKTFLYDERFTLADLGGACGIATLLRESAIQLSALEPYPRVRAWYDRITTREAWQRVEERCLRVPRLHDPPWFLEAQKAR